MQSSLRVMTRNLYLGADVNRPVLAAPGDLPTAVAETRAVLERTDFGVRARLVAAEIARTEPDLIGLQEVADWQLGETEQDFLALLLDELGGSHVVAREGVRAQVELTTDQGRAKLVLRDVILARAGLVTGSGGDASYAENLELPLEDRSVTVLRGYQWVDLDGLRFVNTHLEAHDLDVAVAQARRLADSLGDRPTVVVGDLNSDPDDAERSAPYDVLVAAGLRDLADAGPTWGFSEDLSDADSSGFDQRIDHVLGRGVRATSVNRTGIGPDDRDPTTGLWASDHAGVVVGLELE